MADPRNPRPSLAPRNWGGWLAVGLLWLLGVLPRWIGRALVAPLGPLMRVTMTSRRRIAERNLTACFPEWDEARREEVLRGCFASIARMLAEMAWSWAGPRQDIGAIATIKGLEHLRNAAEDARGALLISAHYTCLEIGGRACFERVPVHAVYRRLRNPVVEWYQNRGRAYYTLSMIEKNDLRSVIRALRRGEVVWYAPDQDFGPRESLFAPFFGVLAATLQATQRLPAMTGCRLMVMGSRFDASSGRYEIEISPPLEDFPGDDPAADLARVNAALEARIREAPEQYWWVHRRFKTRPEGEPPFYGSESRRAAAPHNPARNHTSDDT